MGGLVHGGATTGETRWAWAVLGCLSLLLFLITASTFSSLGVVLPTMVKELSWNWSGAGLGFTLLGAACGASSWFPTLLIRRFGVRATLLTGAGVMVAGFVALASAHSLLLYFVGTTLCGCGYQMVALIPGTHVLSTLFARRGRAFGIYFTAGALGGVAGPLAVNAIMGATGQDWRAFWLMQAAAVVAVGALCALVVGGRAGLEAARARTAIALEALSAETTDAGLARPSRIHRTREPWTVAAAVRTPQFYVILAAYFGHLLCGVTVASLSVAHLTERGVAAAVAGGMLSFEALMQTAARVGGGVIGDRIDPRWLLIFSLASMVVGCLALSVAHDTVTMLIYATGTGLGFGLTALAVTLLLLNYYGDRHNLEIFSLTCLVGALSALGPFIGGMIRDATGGFAPTFVLFAAVLGVVLLGSLFLRPPQPKGEGAALAADPSLQMAKS